MGSIPKDLGLYAGEVLEFCEQNLMGHFSEHSEVQNSDRAEWCTIEKILMRLQAKKKKTVIVLEIGIKVIFVIFWETNELYSSCLLKI